MNGRRAVRPAATRMCAIAMLTAMTAVTAGLAGPASAQPRSGAARSAPQHPLAAHGRVAPVRPAARSRGDRTRTVTLATLVRGVAVRSEPSPAAKLAGRIRDRGTRVTVQCYISGARVAGNPIWYRVSRPLHGYVTSYYINSHEDPAAGVGRCATRSFSRTYHTLVRGVHIRYWPTIRAQRLATLGRMGSKVTVNCYVTGQRVNGDSIWYHSVRPLAGFLSGTNLNTGRDPAYRIPACW
jgi:hypothetical protein